MMSYLTHTKRKMNVQVPDVVTQTHCWPYNTLGHKPFQMSLIMRPIDAASGGIKKIRQSSVADGIFEASHLTKSYIT